MKSKKRIIALVIAMVLLLVCFVGATFAYFTDLEATRTNTITVGNVEIKLYESDSKYNATDLNQKTDEGLSEDATQQRASLEFDDEKYPEFLAKHAPIVPDEDVDKYTYIENTGLNAAYVRFVVSVPEALDEHVNLIWNESTDYTLSGPVDATVGEGEDAVAYKEYTFTLNNPLEPGDFTEYGLAAVELDADMTEADVAALVASGALVNTNRTFDVLVRAEAIQTSDSFDTAAAAFAVFAENSSDAASDNM